MSYRPVEMPGVSPTFQGPTFQEVKPRCTYLTEEFPRLPTSADVSRGRLRRPRLSRFNTLPVTFGEIQEVEEEGVSRTDEERAQRTFLQSLESLRRSTQTLHVGRGRLSSCNTSSLDLGDAVIRERDFRAW